MRAQLVALLPEVEALDGTAESMPLPDGSARAVVVAQAFHWFDPEPALAEIARVLEQGGGLGLVWNERDESVPWVAELSTLLDWGERRPYRRDQDWAALVAASGLFTPLQHRQLSYQQELDVDTLVERALSTSYIAARPAEQNVELADAVRALADGFPDRFELPYVTDVHWCHRR
jgi:ubiquinone/menaquinone biosynthesis C-methylase UbiE